MRRWESSRPAKSAQPFEAGDIVIVETEDGLESAIVEKIKPESKSGLPSAMPNDPAGLRIVRKANLRDLNIIKEQRKKEAEALAEEDKKKKEQIEVKNIADTLVYTTEKALKDAGDKVNAEIKTTVEEKVEALKKVKDGDDLEIIKKATEDLSQVAQKIGEAMYKQQATESKPAEEKPAEEKKAEEAQYEEVKK